MIRLYGQYGTAKVFTDQLDYISGDQVIALLNQKYARDAHIRMMPDVHAGVGCTIGTTMRITNAICPNLVGVDIGCGMLVARLENRDIDFERLDHVIRQYVPSGFAVHDVPPEPSITLQLHELYCRNFVDIGRAACSLGTLGGGNHFIEIERDDEIGDLYLVIHTGSRHLGVDVACYYQRIAERNCKNYQQEIDDMIRRYKAEGRQREIQDEINRIKASIPTQSPGLAYVTGSAMRHYLHDMSIAQWYAQQNRIRIAAVLRHYMDWEVDKVFTTVHNYIDMGRMILRKGAVSADKGEELLIPMNMRDGSLLCVGKGNSDWNFSAPHGAGRLMSRAKARETLSMNEFTQTMQDVWSTSVNVGTIDESPMAYKPMADILRYIEPTVTVKKILKPVYNFKAGDA